MPVEMATRSVRKPSPLRGEGVPKGRMWGVAFHATASKGRAGLRRVDTDAVAPCQIRHAMLQYNHTNKTEVVVMKRFLSFLSILAVLLSGCSFASNEPAKIKIMSWNILNPAWGGTPAEMRSEAFFSTLTAQMPDVIGLQEASTAWHTEFAALPAPFAAVCDTTNGGKDCMTMFFYNTETLTLIESGIEDLDANSNIRVVSWAVFEAKNGKQFLVTNTHPDSREAECLKHTEQFLDIARRLYEEKGLPMLSVGDFNAVETSDAYALSINDGYTDCKYAEGVELVRDIDSYLLGDFGGKVTKGQGSRDHVFFKGDVTPITFETLFDDTIHDVSDHLPVVAEVEIGRQ